MEAIQLELFKEEGNAQTYIRKLGNWFLVDNFKRHVFMPSDKNRYRMVVNSHTIFPSFSEECRVSQGDIQSRPINMYDYLQLGQMMRYNDLYKYNKRLGKVVEKSYR